MASMGSVFLAAEAIDLVKEWLDRAGRQEAQSRKQGSALRDLMADSAGVEVCHVVRGSSDASRGESDRCQTLRTLVDSNSLPGFVSGWNRWFGARLGPLMPGMSFRWPTGACAPWWAIWYWMPAPVPSVGSFEGCEALGSP